MPTDLFKPQVKDKDQATINFVQDRATCHTKRENISLPLVKFPGKLISRFGDVE